jgi:hypothetical protein
VGCYRLRVGTLYVHSVGGVRGESGEASKRGRVTDGR